MTKRSSGRPPPLHSDDIPMTGEEDPLVEVDSPGFADTVAEFTRAERDGAPDRLPGKAS